MSSNFREILSMIDFGFRAAVTLVWALAAYVYGHEKLWLDMALMLGLPLLALLFLSRFSRLRWLRHLLPWTLAYLPSARKPINVPVGKDWPEVHQAMARYVKRNYYNALDWAGLSVELYKRKDGTPVLAYPKLAGLESNARGLVVTMLPVGSLSTKQIAAKTDILGSNWGVEKVEVLKDSLQSIELLLTDGSDPLSGTRQADWS